MNRAMQERGYPVMAISAVAQQNLDELLYRVQAMLDALPMVEAEEDEVLPEITPGEDEKAFAIYRVGDHAWWVEGAAIERIAQMTKWDYYEPPCAFNGSCARWGLPMHYARRH
ncbi:MAG: hypothetical protein R3E79_55415 [Caldilineaceae bacterium]